MLIDTHCHLHDREFFTAEEAEECLLHARECGVEKIVCVGTSHEDSLAAREFAEAHEGVYWTYGIHPEHANNHEQSECIFSGHAVAPARRRGGRAASFSTEGRPLGVTSEDPLKEHSRLLVGIGEVGLDYHYDGYDRIAQIKLFEQMLQLAVDNDLPVSFHVREAFADFFPVVENFPGARGVVHSFTDSKKMLKRILNETEFYVGMNGLATYSTLPLPPLEHILLETDAPFLAPVPYRGEKNEPAYVANVAEWLAGKLGMPVAEVAEQTTSNANALFHLCSD